MSTERDIIIERLEQKLAARDKEFTQMQDALRESIIAEMEKRFSDKIKLRESTLEDLKSKFGEKINDLIQMNKSLRDSVMDKNKNEMEIVSACESRMEKMEHRLVELNSAYDGVMKELLDQKSIIHEIRPPRPKDDVRAKHDSRQKEDVRQKEAVPPEKEVRKTQYIIADNYVPKDHRKPQIMIEVDDKSVDADLKNKDRLKEQTRRPAIKKSEKIMEGVEISETLKR